jgi:hypothetical protein
VSEPPRPALRWVALALLAVASATLVASRAHAADDPPRFSITRDPGGEGFVVPGTGLWFAGDVTITGGAPEGDPAFLELDDVSLLLRWEPAARLAFFAEARLEETIELVEAVGIERESAEISIERLYADVLLTPRLTLRAGKFFTPFGLWNVVRRAPLVWTIEEPAVVEGTFPKRATGLSLVYQTTWQGWTVDATAYGPAQDKLSLRASREDGLMAGGRVAIGRALGSAYGTAGLNVAGFEDHGTRRWAQGYGTDLELTFRGVQLTSEFVYEDLHGRARRQYGFYAQAAVPLPLADDLYGVLRIEHFRPRHGERGTGELVGVFWRPLPFLILKTNYLFGEKVEDVLEPGFYTSVVLFF